MTRTILIGDVHGMYDEFVKLVALVKPTPADKVILLGDLVDKGPRSADVVKYAYTLHTELPDLVLVKGNHEEMHERWWHHVQKGKQGEKRMMRNKDIAETQASLDERHRNFLFHAPLCTTVFYRSPVSGERLLGVAVHGGIPTDLELLADLENSSAPYKPARDMANRVLRLRYVDRKTGDFVPADAQGADRVFWAELYDGSHGTVFYGHQPYVEAKAPVIIRGRIHALQDGGHTVGLDLGCVFGNVLCALVLHPDGEQECITVPASKKYAEVFAQGT
jgi:hypothetical protein